MSLYIVDPNPLGEIQVQVNLERFASKKTYIIDVGLAPIHTTSMRYKLGFKVPFWML